MFQLLTQTAAAATEEASPFLDWLTQNALPGLDWNFAMVTLVFRFIAVFFVLAFIQISLQVSSRVILGIENREARAKASASRPSSAATGLAAKPSTSDPAAVDDATAAAIGMALDREYRPTLTLPEQSGPSAWSVAGRIRRLNRRN